MSKTCDICGDYENGRTFRDGMWYCPDCLEELEKDDILDIFRDIIIHADEPEKVRELARNALREAGDGEV